MKAEEELRRQWAPMDPAAGEPGPDEERRATTLAAILASETPILSRRWILAGAGAAAVSVAVAAVVVAERGADIPRAPGLAPPAPRDGYRMTPVMLTYSAPGGENDARGRLERVADCPNTTRSSPGTCSPGSATRSPPRSW
jgi:hypothetical protein